MLSNSEPPLNKFAFFFFTAPATTEIYTLSLHDALPICDLHRHFHQHANGDANGDPDGHAGAHRSEEHTSELQSHSDLVCRLLLEKKKLSIETEIQLVACLANGPGATARVCDELANAGVN